MSAKSNRPEPGWYVASKRDDHMKYVVIVPTRRTCPVVAVYTDGNLIATYTYPINEIAKDFPWHDYTLEKLNESDGR